MASIKMANLLNDFKSGPLDYYRKKASFDWKKLKVLIESEEVIEYKNKLYNELQKYPAYQIDNLQTASLDEERFRTARQVHAYKSIELLSLGYVLQNVKYPRAASEIMMQLAPAASIKYGVSNSLFNDVVRTLGTSRHGHFITDCEDDKISGCYCLTEIAHGSNVKGMQTTATFNQERQSFVLNSSTFEAAKCWAGGLGQLATHAVVYAQLITNGIKHGLHCFVVPVRDPKTLLPHPGVIVGDMGEKIGLNGIDNGFVIFNNYEIPRENLLNKLGDVTQEGEYITPFKDPNKRHGAALGALSMGRVNITSMCEFYGSKAITIAIRYGAVRKQFGPDDKEEIPILEYQSHQYRLLPYLAAVYVLRIFSMKLIEVQYQFAIDSYLGVNKELLAELGPELHALSSASKPVSGWTMRDTIQECRETCGGHGYLKVSGIGDIRNDNDANLTYEGENHILIQQTSNWLLKLWPLILKGETISSPLKSVNFLSHGLRILQQPNIQISSVADACSPQNIISMYQWLVVYLLKRTYNKFQNDLNNGKDAFAARNNNQVFYAKNLSIAFIQHFMLQVMYEKISATSDPEIRSVLEKLLSLYGLFSLEKQHLTLFYQGAILPGSDFVTLIQEAILKLCSEVKNDAVSLVDVVAPPDFILKSVLGLSDGQVYRNLESAIFRSPYAMSRPKWWQDIKTNVQSKL